MVGPAAVAAGIRLAASFYPFVRVFTCTGGNGWFALFGDASSNGAVGLARLRPGPGLPLASAVRGIVLRIRYFDRTVQIRRRLQLFLFRRACLYLWRLKRSRFIPRALCELVEVGRANNQRAARISVYHQRRNLSGPSVRGR